MTITREQIEDWWGNTFQGDMRWGAAQMEKVARCVNHYAAQPLTPIAGAVTAEDVERYCSRYAGELTIREGDYLSYALVADICNTLSHPLTPIAGPPDLEGVEDDAMIFYHMGDWEHEESVGVGTARLLRSSPITSGIEWYILLGIIPLGPIAPPEPEPEPELPKCPVCGEVMEKKSYCRSGPVDNWFELVCYGQPRTEGEPGHQIVFCGPTEAAAIAAAKGGE